MTQTKERLQRFEGTPVMPKEYQDAFPQVALAPGNLGEPMWNMFLEEAGRYGPRGQETLTNGMSYDAENDVIRGSHPFAVVLMNKLMEEAGASAATQAELEYARAHDALSLKGIYAETGFVFRTETDRDFERNTPIAKNLASQLREREYEGQIEDKVPLVILYKDLKLEDADNEYGLQFAMKDTAKAIEGDILSSPSESRFFSKDIDRKTGLPAKLDKEGNRILWTRESGISRLGSGGSVLSSCVCSLAVSVSRGRVVMACAEGAQKILDEPKGTILSKIEEEHSFLVEEANRKAAEARRAVIEIFERK
jgi:hypothetical protein